MKPIVLYIDEEPMALHTMGKRLRRCFGDEVEVKTMEPCRTIEETLTSLNSIVDLVSVVVDQKLSAAGTAEFVGTELAMAIRQTDLKMPIYILTNFADDVDGSMGEIEYVLSKADITSDDELPKISARLRRHVNIFQDFLSKREARFEELLRKGYENKLTEIEQADLAQLSYQRERKISAAELLDSIDLKRKLDATQSALDRIINQIK